MSRQQLDLNLDQTRVAQATESLFEHIFSNIHLLTAYMDRDFNFVRVNRRYAEAAGYDEEFFPGKNHFELYTNEENEAIFRRVVESGEPHTVYARPFEYPDHPDRGITYWDWTVEPVKARDGKVIGVILMLLDVTENKRAELKLRESERKLSILIDSIPGMVYRCRNDRDWTVEFASDGCKTLTGYGPEELTSGRLSYGGDIIHPEDREEVWCAVQTAIDRRRPFKITYRIKTSKDETRWVWEQGTGIWSEDGGLEALEGLIMDVTDRVRAERALKHEKDYLYKLHNSLADAVFTVGIPSRKIESVNRIAEKIFGYTPCELIGQETKVLYSSDEDFGRFGSRLAGAVDAGEAVVTMETSLVRKSGEVFPAEVTTTFLRNGAGASAVISIVRDITERKRSEEELMKYKTLFDNIPDLAYICDAGGNILYVNGAFKRLAGFSPSEFAGRPFAPLFDAENLRKAEDAYRRTLAGQTCQYELRFKSTGVICEYMNFPMTDETGRVTGVLGIARDITEKVRMEEELQKAGRLESLGVLAGGIAHDFNNILTGILGNISVARKSAGHDDRLSGSLEATEKAALQARDLTLQLLSFSRGGAPLRKTASIANLLKDCSNFAVSGTNVRCSLEIPEDLRTAEVDSGQIGQVINNLLINAAQSMPGGGTVYVSAENVEIAPRSGVPLPEGKYVLLKVRDHGCGIPRRSLSRIFDPFFSTKKTGSGLGLAVSYTIIKNHGGHISVDSTEGRGTEFRVYLQASEHAAPQEPPADERPARGSGRVLVMDDEEIVRDVVTEMLEVLGYESETAADGEEALRMYCEAREEGRPFDLVIMDLTVPGGLGGREAVKRLLEMDPGARAIVSSGYSNDSVVADFRSYGFRGVISKPYRIKEFSEALKEVMRPPGD